MFSFINGYVRECEKNYITLENNGIGFQIFVANPFSYKIDEEKKLFIYNYIKEDEFSLYGFNTKEEKELFLKLISVKGVGPKLALPMFSLGSVNGILDAIERENILYLTKFPKVGEKVARQIILDLKGKLTKSEESIDSSLEEVVEALTSFGYKNSDIKKILPKLDSSLKIEDQIKEALKLLLK